MSEHKRDSVVAAVTDALNKISAEHEKELETLRTDLSRVTAELKGARDEINRWKRLYHEDAKKPGEQV